MDSVTQAVLGGVVSYAILSKHIGKRAALYGAAFGTLPDLDVLIDFGGPIENMTLPSRLFSFVLDSSSRSACFCLDDGASEAIHRYSVPQVVASDFLVFRDSQLGGLIYGLWHTGFMAVVSTSIFTFLVIYY